MLLPYVANSPNADAQCQENINTTIEDDGENANVSFSDSAGNMVNVSLPVGEHDFSYTMENGTICDFTISVICKYCYLLFRSNVVYCVFANTFCISIISVYFAAFD